MSKEKAIKNQVEELETQLAVYQERIQALKSPKGNLTLVESPIKHNQLLIVLQRTPEEHIHQRPGKGGGQWNYVTGVYVTKILNYVFGWCWDYQIIDKGNVEENGKVISVWVLGRLTIKDPQTMQPILIKEQFGGADVKRKRDGSLLDFANDLKASATDALKKCASAIGIAGDVYGANEFKEIAQDKVADKVVENTEDKTELRKLLKELTKRGAKTQRAMFAMLKEQAGMEWKDFNNKSAKICKMALANLLSKKIV